MGERTAADLLVWNEPPGAGAMAVWELYLGLRFHFRHRAFGVEHAAVRRAVTAMDDGQASWAGQRVAVERFGRTLLTNGTDPIDAFFVWLNTQLPGARNLDHWQRYERILNVRLGLALAGLAPPALAALVGDLAPLPRGTTALHPAWLREPDAKRRVLGYPDVLLADARVAVLIEMKVRGTGTDRELTFDQLLKYANLVAALAPRTCVLMLVAPDGKQQLFGKHIATAAAVPRADGGRGGPTLRVDGAATLARLEAVAADPRNEREETLGALLAGTRRFGADVAARLDALAFERTRYSDFVSVLEARGGELGVPPAAIERFRVLDALARPR